MSFGEKEYKFKLNPDDKEGVPVAFESFEKIGKGNFAEIFMVTIKIRNQLYPFIVKKFFPRVFSAAEDAVHIWEVAKDHGLKVFSTYRLSEEGGMILMTMGHTEKWICIGTNEGSRLLSDFKENFMESIDNFPEILLAMLHEAEKAAKARIALSSDCFFFLVDRDKKRRLDFMIGDLDNVMQSSTNYDGLFFGNYANIKQALQFFIHNNLPPHKQGDYLYELRQAGVNFMAQR